MNNDEHFLHFYGGLRNNFLKETLQLDTTDEEPPLISKSSYYDDDDFINIFK